MRDRERSPGILSPALPTPPVRLGRDRAPPRQHGPEPQGGTPASRPWPPAQPLTAAGCVGRAGGRAVAPSPRVSAGSSGKEVAEACRRRECLGCGGPHPAVLGTRPQRPCPHDLCPCGPWWPWWPWACLRALRDVGSGGHGARHGTRGVSGSRPGTLLPAGVAGWAPVERRGGPGGSRGALFMRTEV